MQKDSTMIYMHPLKKVGHNTLKKCEESSKIRIVKETVIANGCLGKH